MSPTKANDLILAATKGILIDGKPARRIAALAVLTKPWVGHTVCGDRLYIFTDFR